MDTFALVDPLTIFIYLFIYIYSLSKLKSVFICSISNAQAVISVNSCRLVPISFLNTNIIKRLQLCPLLYKWSMFSGINSAKMVKICLNNCVINILGRCNYTQMVCNSFVHEKVELLHKVQVCD